MNFDDADLLALCVEVVDDFFCAFANGTHSNDDFRCVRSAIVIERLVVCADLCIYFFHVSIYEVRSFVVNNVAGFPMLEEGFWLLCGTHGVRVIRMKGVVLECLERIPVNHFLQILVVPGFDLLLFVGSSETVEEVEHRKMSADCRKMSNCGKVHSLLYGV